MTNTGSFQIHTPLNKMEIFHTIKAIKTVERRDAMQMKFGINKRIGVILSRNLVNL